MIRLKFWNVNNFSLNKIYKEKIKTDEYDQELYESEDRQAIIVNEVFGQNEPDIFVIVELYARIKEVSTEGTLLTINGECFKGIWLLLNILRRKYGKTWCLVPPIHSGALGYREGIAVFYNSAKLQFTGPYFLSRLTSDGFPRAHVPNQEGYTNLIDYPEAFNGFLPTNRTCRVNVGGTNHDIPENRFAGQWSYYTASQEPKRIGFPDSELDVAENNTKTYRSPFFTKFIDITNGANNRIINLFSLHTSPCTAGEAVRNLALVPEIMTIADNNVNVIAGDFNVDSFDTEKNAAYKKILEHYTMHLDPRIDKTAAINKKSNIGVNRRPYCMTHFLPVDKATPYSNAGISKSDPQHNVYPRFGYMGSMGGFNFQDPVDTGAIDNIFTWYGNNIQRPDPDAHNISIINTITGKPYNHLTTAPAGVTAELTGGLTYKRLIKNEFPLPEGADPTLGGIAEVWATLFSHWGNFERIHSTSDHMALSIDI
jgi:hypothetical protein